MERLEVRLEIKKRRESIAREHGSGGTWVLQSNWETKTDRNNVRYYNSGTHITIVLRDAAFPNFSS